MFTTEKTLPMNPSVTPLEIAQTPEDRALQVREESMEAAKRYASKSRSENTWRGYQCLGML